LISKQNANIVLVDRDHTSTNTFKDQLTYRGYVVNHVSTEQDFITLILKKDKSFDLVIIIHADSNDKPVIVDSVLNNINLPILAIESSINTEFILKEIDEKIKNTINAFILNQENESTEDLIEAFALHEIICDDNGVPINYRFLDADKKFLKRIGKTKEELIGKTALDLYPNTEHEWIETFGRVALSRNPEVVSFYSAEFDNYYEARIYSPEKGQFAALFIDSKKVKGKYVCK